MRESEFWNALEQGFGSASGRSLASDLYLTSLDMTASEALRSGFEPIVVWHALIDEADAGESIRWIHRRPIKKN